MHVHQIHVLMVELVYQMDSEDLLVNVYLDLVVNDVKIEMVVLINRAKMVVFVLVHLVVLTHVNVLQVLKDKIANKVQLYKVLRMIFCFI
jgi:hypothetical protein